MLVERFSLFLLCLVLAAEWLSVVNVRSFCLHVSTARRNREWRSSNVKTLWSDRKTTTRSPSNKKMNLDASTSEQQESKFKILTCTSTACCQKRSALGMESLATFVALFARARSTQIQVEEGPCLGSCKLAPCVGVEHEDYVGCVALEGMTNQEFTAKA
jgi:NADH:ubiquinone oxidoreductase subunit E